MKLLKLIILSLTQPIIIEYVVCVVYYAKFWGCKKQIKTKPIRYCPHH